jgi:hypothetical protein
MRRRGRAGSSSRMATRDQPLQVVTAQAAEKGEEEGEQQQQQNGHP